MQRRPLFSITRQQKTPVLILQHESRSFFLLCLLRNLRTIPVAVQKIDDLRQLIAGECCLLTGSNRFTEGQPFFLRSIDITKFMIDFNRNFFVAVFCNKGKKRLPIQRLHFLSLRPRTKLTEAVVLHGRKYTHIVLKKPVR